MSINFVKDPAALLDYQVDWSAWLGTDAIATSSWNAQGLTVSAQSNTGTVATVWLSGGTTGSDYTVTNQITTTGGRTNLRSIHLAVAAQ